MITSHPGIVVPPECGFAVWWHVKYLDWDVLRLSEFMEDLKTSKKIETWKLDYDKLSSFIESRRPASYAETVSLVYEFYATGRKPGFHRWGDKNNFHLNHIPTLRALFPEALFVHIVRDGRDVACSYRKLGDANIQSVYAPRLPKDIAVIAHEWQTNVGTVTNAFAGIPPTQAFDIRYEDLVRDTKSSLRRLCEFLGEDFDPAMLEYHRLNQSEQLEPSEFLQWKENTLREPLKERIGNFTRELSVVEITAFEEIAGGMLEAHGYLRNSAVSKS
jgi:hypothetical protein